MANPNFDTLVATTLRNYRPQLADNITEQQIVWMQLKQRGFVEEREGGTSLVEPLLFGRNTTVGSYRGYDILDTSPQEGMSAAEFDWKQIAGTVTISGEEEFKNSGAKTQVLSLLKGKIRQLELSMMMEMNRQIQGDGTGNLGKDITGLAALVEDGAAWSTIGGIDSNANPYWRNQWIGGTATFASAGVNRMRTIYNSCCRGTVKPTIILTSQYLFEEYEKTLVPNERFIDMSLGDAGFMNLMFKTTPIVFDDDMPFEDLGTDEHQMLFLNVDFLKFAVGKGRNFVVSDFVKPDNQDAKVSSVIVYGNFTISNRARNGRLTDLT
jgi:hypothetical protein